MAKRIRNYRKHHSQRVMGAIVRELADQKLATSIKTGITIDADTAARAVREGRDPFEIARAASAALKASS